MYLVSSSEYLNFAYVPRMGDVRLTPREIADLLTMLDEGVRRVDEARSLLIKAMAARSSPRMAREGKPGPGPRQATGAAVKGVRRR